MKISLVAGASDLPWSGITFGLAISSIWYWCSDQVSHQPKRIRVVENKKTTTPQYPQVFSTWLHVCVS
jgi:hypothetical protein